MHKSPLHPLKTIVLNTRTKDRIKSFDVWSTTPWIIRCVKRRGFMARLFHNPSLTQTKSGSEANWPSPNSTYVIFRIAGGLEYTVAEKSYLEIRCRFLSSISHRVGWISAHQDCIWLYLISPRKGTWCFSLLLFPVGALLLNSIKYWPITVYCNRLIHCQET